MKKNKLLLTTWAISLASALGAMAQVNITTWQADTQHTGANLNETTLTPALVSSPGNFGLLFSQPMDGQCYTQPLYVSGLTIGAATHNVVYLETEHDTMYAFDADNNTGANASPLWSKSFLTAGVNTPPPQADVGSGDISEELGNTATPVIDVTGGTIYCVSKVKVTATGAYQQYLHALDLKTGAEKFGGPVLINPTFAGSATDGTGGVVPFSPLHSHDRAALTFYNGIVYIMYASHSDTQPYHGEILGYNASTLALTKTFITTPNGNEAGIWQGGANAAIDTAGNMFVAVANGDWDQKTSPYTTGTDWGESFLKLPTTGTFTVSFSNPLNWFTPYNWGNNPGELNNGDLDLGSSGVTLLPDQTGGSHPHLLVGGGKGGTLYVIDRDNLGGNLAPTAGHNNSVEEITEGHSMFVTPAYFNGNIYYAAAGGKMTQRAVGYNPADGTYISKSAVTTNFTYNGGHGSGAFITANGTANGILWTLDLGGPAHLQAYNAANIAGDPIYSGAAVLPGNINVSGPKFALPTVVNGKAYFSGYVYTAASNTSVGYLLVFGRPAAPVGTPVAASNLTASPVSSSQITLNWTDNSTNESGFKVARATTLAGPYTTLTPSPSAGANVTTFTDSGLTAGTTYYYQVVATNANGDATPSLVASSSTFPVYSENGLVAYWSMDETSGSTSTDLTGNGHLGTWEGEQTPDAGFINDSHWFHGTGAVASRISVPNKADLQFTASQSFTLAAWVKPAALRSSAESVIAKSRDTGNYYGISINAANNWVARGPVSDVTGPAATQDVWTHVAVVQDGAAGTRKLYINGALAATGTAQAADGTGALWISQANSGGGTVIEAFPGNIDEVRIYSRALASTEITNVMSAPILQAASSQTQGANTYGLIIAPSKVRVVESRKGSTVGKYNLALSFSAPVSGITATLGLQGGGAATGTVNSVTYDGTGKVVTVVLTGVANTQKLNLHLAGIQPGNGTADIPFNVLWGDVNQDNVVDSLDASIVANNHTSAVNGTSFVYDINCDGAVNGTDDGLVTGAAGTNIGTQTDSNIAIYKTASASTSNGANLPALAFDGDTKTTRWESASADPQWITVDLGSVSTIHGITLYWENAAGKTYTVEASPDNATWTNLVTETAGVSGATKSYTAPAGSSGRYVRMTGTTRTTGYGYSIYEFQVLGIPGVTTTPTITSTLTKAGTVGTALTYNITATNTPTSYSATPLPPGLTLNATTGAITGTPTTAGTTNTTVTATNGSGAGSPATLVFTISGGGAVPVINSGLTQAGTVGTALTYNITATNTPTSYGATPLPPGLALNATTGAITGSPTTAGTTNTTITATNGTGTSTPATLVFTISAAGGGGVPVITSGLTAAATVGGSFSYQIAATNTPTSYNATNLPSGLTVSTTTGAITGYPNAAGTANVSITATNATGTSTAATLVITTSAGTDTNLAQGMPTTTSSVTGANTGAMAVDGNTGTRWESLYTDTEYIYVDLGATKNIHSVIINWETAAGANYTIQSSNDLTTWTDLTTPVTGNTTGGIHAYTGLTGSGRYVRIAGTLRATQYGYSIWELQVFGSTAGGGAVPVINSALTKAGTVGTALTYNITATNTPTSYSATPLPPGLTLNATTGAITGTPTTAGTTNTTITATNAAGASSPATLVFTVNAAGAVPVITSALTQSGTVGTALTYTITATNTPTSYSATPLPPGLSLNIATGAITGSPTVAGTTNTTITATNGTGTSSPATLVFTIGAAGSVPVINSALTQSATVGGAVNYQITATNAPTSYNATNLPSGLIVSTVTGAITGYPNAPGTTNVSITATNASGTSTAATLVITTSAGTDINLALSKTTTTSSVTGANTGAMAVDGNEGTRWESLYTDSEYIYVDLGAVQTIHSVIINWETAAGKNYTIQSSNDLTTWTDLVTPVTGNTTAGIHAYTGLTGSGRYVRVAGTLRATAYGYSIYELQVFGISAVDTNIAQGATSTASSFQAGNLVANGNDGNTGTRWAAADGTFPQWWKVDLGASKTLSRVDIAWYSSATRSYKYKIETSTNDTTYTLYKDNTANTAFGDTSDTGAATARYVKITLNGASAGFGSAYEFKVYGH